MADIAERYGQLVTERTATSDRAEECSNLTLPYAYPDDNIKSQDNLNRGLTQGFGAMLVNHIVGKLALTILPPSQPFYRLSASQEAMEAVSGGDENAKFEVEKILAKSEEGVLRVINKSNFRDSLYPALRQAVITGNCIIERLEGDKKYKVINLKNYVITRDYKGTIVEFITKELMTYSKLPEEFRSKVEEDKRDEDIELFTMVKRNEDGKYTMTQELLQEVVGEEIVFDKFSDKFIDVTWNLIDGEDYARSFVEDHLGTLIALEKTTKIVVEGMAEAVKVIKFITPNGTTKFEDYQDAKHGDSIVGEATDITQEVKHNVNNLNIAKELIVEMKQELARAFLVAGASIRDSERTTAQEVAMVANEVEASLGGIYTAISGKIQRPLVEQSMKELNIEGGKDIDVIITTGVQALGRNVELSKTNNLIQELQLLGSIVGQEQVAKYVNVGAMASSIVANSGVASKEFLRSKQEIEQIEMAQKQEAMEQQALQGALPQAGAMAMGQAGQ